MDDTTMRAIFYGWCQQALLEPTEARFEAFEAGYNTRAHDVYNETLQLSAELAAANEELALIKGERA